MNRHGQTIKREIPYDYTLILNKNLSCVFFARESRSDIRANKYMFIKGLHWKTSAHYLLNFREAAFCRTTLPKISDSFQPGMQTIHFGDSPQLRSRSMVSHSCVCYLAVSHTCIIYAMSLVALLASTSWDACRVNMTPPPPPLETRRDNKREVSNIDQ